MGDEDGLSLDVELDWNYHHHLDRSSEVSRRARRVPSVENPDGLFLIKSFRVDLKPGLEPYLHSKLTESLQEYLLDQFTSLNELLGKMRIRWEEVANSGRSSTWEKVWEVVQVMVSRTEEEEPETISRDQRDRVRARG
ncbi:hypothetical protein Pst134EA_031707 [Puccinia striiformis f. sp. tritici]|uniref:uncharacterized protein n=1 Tax=Puccinia striiformis f. sp. tritici TaxID=168172 RepID=UPI002008A1FE|nr:uncharacterized protein Pst134EA_031707 [Puccinia striiformis f. sp. tritici]KAH9442644.1 hypothetical protein Pst134EA_031707 [Puccinia striiformis f. sp. tritici]